MPETQPEKQFSPLVVPRTIEDLIYLQLQDFKDEFRYTRQEIYSRMYKLEDRIDSLEDKIDRLADKLDNLSKKL